MKNDPNKPLYYIDFSKSALSLGGSSFAQIVNKLGQDTPTVADTEYFVKAFNAVQDAIAGGLVAAGHDISAGGMITALLEMCFADNNVGVKVDLSALGE